KRSAYDGGGGEGAWGRAAAHRDDTRLLRGDEAKRLGRGGGIHSVGLLGEPRQAAIGDRLSQRTLSQRPFGAPRCLSLLLLKPRLLWTPRSKKGARRIAHRSPSPCSTPAVTWWRSSARTSRASCVSTSRSAKPGARWAWASARARSQAARPRPRSSSPCWRLPAAAAW